MTVRADNFNRGNANPIGGNWSTLSAENPLQIVSSAVFGTAAGVRNMAYWNADSFQNDQYSQLKIVIYDDTYGSMGPSVRCSSSNESAYFLELDSTGWGFGKYVNGTYTIIGVSQTRTNIVGDIFKISVQGTTLSCTINGVVQGYTQTDPDLTSGFPGIKITSNTGSIDDWEGGDIASTIMRRTLSLVGTRIGSRQGY